MKYSVSLNLLAYSDAVGKLTSHIDDVADELADLDAVCDELLDWSVGTELDAGGRPMAVVEVEFTIETDTIGHASSRADELMWNAIHAAGGHTLGWRGDDGDFEVGYATSDDALSARLVDA